MREKSKILFYRALENTKRAVGGLCGGALPSWSLRNMIPISVIVKERRIEVG